MTLGNSRAIKTGNWYQKAVKTYVDSSVNTLIPFVQSLIVSDWTLRDSAADNNWYGITWSPELSLFVAVAYTGAGNRVMTTPRIF